MSRRFRVRCHIQNLDPPAKEGAVHAEWLVRAESEEDAIAQVRNRIDAKYVANFSATEAIFDLRPLAEQTEELLSNAPADVAQEMRTKLAALERKKSKQ